MREIWIKNAFFGYVSRIDLKRSIQSSAEVNENVIDAFDDRPTYVRAK